MKVNIIYETKFSINIKGLLPLQVVNFAASGRCNWFSCKCLILLHMACCKWPAASSSAASGWNLTASGICCKWLKFGGSVQTRSLQMDLLQVPILWFNLIYRETSVMKTSVKNFLTRTWSVVRISHHNVDNGETQSSKIMINNQFKTYS